jgi:predicted N-acetyltransferase YhbS
MPDVVIRKAVRADIREIEAVTVAAYAQYRALVPAPLFDAYSDELRRLADFWDEAETVAALLDGKIAGSVMFYASAAAEGLGLPKEWAGFRKLAVDPQARGHGLGLKLSRACADMARERAAQAVGIHTASFMTAAQRIYERMGFVRVPEYDLHATDFVPPGSGESDIQVFAYRLDLAAP